MLKGKNFLSEKEKLFCHFYIKTNNVRESAISSGYRIFPEKYGLKLLEKDLVQKEISRLKVLQNQSFDINKIISGYMRIAFGCVSDPFKLVFKDDDQKLDIDSLDLFNVSEIKKIKGGGIEVKFFDRIKALESLLKCNIESKSNENSFYDAFNKGLEELKGEVE